MQGIYNFISLFLTSPFEKINFSLSFILPALPSFSFHCMFVCFNFDFLPRSA